MVGAIRRDLGQHWMTHKSLAMDNRGTIRATGDCKVVFVRPSDSWCWEEAASGSKDLHLPLNPHPNWIPAGNSWASASDLHHHLVTAATFWRHKCYRAPFGKAPPEAPPPFHLLLHHFIALPLKIKPFGSILLSSIFIHPFHFT